MTGGWRSWTLFSLQSNNNRPTSARKNSRGEKFSNVSCGQGGGSGGGRSGRRVARHARARKYRRRQTREHLQPDAEAEGGEGGTYISAVPFCAVWNADCAPKPQTKLARRKPPVPRRDERPTMGLVSDTNFLTANAVDAILAVPANRQRPPVDYLVKEDYGRVPEYLGHVKREIQAENEMVEEFVREQMGISSTAEDEAPEMPHQEQKELVDQLRAKWENVNARYQQLEHHTFFEHGRLKAKARLEGELDEIEAYIAKLTCGPVTVVP